MNQNTIKAQMHVNLIIPTYDRVQALKDCVQSIMKSTYEDKSIIVVIDGNRQMINELIDEPIAVRFSPQRKDWIWNMNRALNSFISDGIIYASDDIVFQPDCISIAVKALQERFSDGDGLVAFKWKGIENESPAFGLMGRKFIERFPERAVFCPDYIHYASDSELKRFAVSIGKFHFCREALITHKAPKDNTYRLAREFRSKDDRLYYRERPAKGYLWGKNFGLVREKARQT